MDVPVSFPSELASRFQEPRLLGRGGMGVVFSAFDLELKRSVAIKIVDPRVIYKEGKRFLLEARCMASIVHRNVVRVFDSGMANGAPYCVMELLSGLSLQDHAKKRTISDSEAIALLRPLLDALACVHERGFLHRASSPGTPSSGTEQSLW